jgi:hypothetical protein
MSPYPKPHRIPVLALTAIIFLLPALATAQPHPREAAFAAAAAQPEAGPSLLAKIRSLLSVLWADTGSGLDPNGAGSRTSVMPGATITGDTGSILDPDGRH